MTVATTVALDLHGVYLTNDNSPMVRIASCHRLRAHANSPGPNSNLAQAEDRLAH